MKNQNAIQTLQSQAYFSTNNKIILSHIEIKELNEVIIFPASKFFKFDIKTDLQIKNTFDESLTF